MNKRLRKLAESRLKDEKVKQENSIPDDVNAVIHDLKVHQIELEIQNEELRNTQEALERTKEEYVRLYHDAPVGYLTLDGTGFIQKCNRTFLEMIEREDAVGKSLTSYIFPEDIP